ncbi:hypothetical protein [Weissella confusa]|uniref:hypothetical protein n=1 Tax=Weissella confusa TaxID=1583 RepID=UPI001080977A|nr:hypothetical protein [Weissella confusa]
MMRKKVGMLLSGLLSLALLAAPVNTIHAETYGHSDAGVGVKNKTADQSQTQSSEDDLSNSNRPTVIVEQTQLPETSAMMKGGVSTLVVILIGSMDYAWYLTRDKKQEK